MKRLFKFIDYFFYVAWNWDVRLAAFVVYFEIKGESRYHLDTTGSDNLSNLAEKGIDISHATAYQPLNYYILEKLMNEAKKDKGNGTFLDIGCGKGRTMVVAAYFGFTKITGIDFSKELCDDAVGNIEKCREKFPDVSFKVINNDAFYFEIPDDCGTILLFNPFDEVIMSGVVNNIVNSIDDNPRTVRVLYANPVYTSLFTDEGFKEIYHIQKMTYLEACILEKKV
jgi:SAM-dependent methyltransferase